MRSEKWFGFAGLGLFFLFPLLGLLQMSDADDAWHAVAAATARSVMRAETTAGDAGCGVVVTAEPPRLVVAGQQTEVTTRAAGDVRSWRAVHVDPNGEFTILVAAAARAGKGSNTLAALDPARIGDLDALGDPGIETVLVGPHEDGGFPVLWLGDLHVERPADRRPTFLAAALRPLRAATAGTATTPAPPEFDATLRGAPFVTRDGVVLALCTGTVDGGIRAVPMAHVREAVSLLDRRAAR